MSYPFIRQGKRCFRRLDRCIISLNPFNMCKAKSAVFIKHIPTIFYSHSFNQTLRIEPPWHLTARHNTINFAIPLVLTSLTESSVLFRNGSH